MTPTRLFCTAMGLLLLTSFYVADYSAHGRPTPREPTTHVQPPVVTPTPKPSRPDWCSRCTDFTAPVNECPERTQSDGACACKVYCEP